MKSLTTMTRHKTLIQEWIIRYDGTITRKTAKFQTKHSDVNQQFENQIDLNNKQSSI